jgi:hypothetical protein
MPYQLIGTQLILLEPVATISGQMLATRGDFFCTGTKDIRPAPDTDTGILKL